MRSIIKGVIKCNELWFKTDSQKDIHYISNKRNKPTRSTIEIYSQEHWVPTVVCPWWKTWLLLFFITLHIACQITWINQWVPATVLTFETRGRSWIGYHWERGFSFSQPLIGIPLRTWLTTPHLTVWKLVVPSNYLYLHLPSKVKIMFTFPQSKILSQGTLEV